MNHIVHKCSFKEQKKTAKREWKYFIVRKGKNNQWPKYFTHQQSEIIDYNIKLRFHQTDIKYYKQLMETNVTNNEPQETVQTELTKLLGIKYPIILAGMAKFSGPKLAAAVTNAGGLGVIGGNRCSPRILKALIIELKKQLKDKNSPYGIDLLLPKLTGNARKTNYDYTKGKLNELIDVIISCRGCKLFVSAVGIPPKYVVDKLHQNGILVMNMVGAPKHITKALNVGVDIICAQGGEGGGHIGSIATSILLPKCVDLVKSHKMTLYPSINVPVVGAGGIYSGRGV
eukprot:153863_1